MFRIGLQLCFLLTIGSNLVENKVIIKRNIDSSVKVYLTERICWWNEICKEEFRSQFRCKCPEWSYCRAPGKYYNAFCTMTTTGYIWQQPGWREAAESQS
ncbi:uncharacterized protein [Leptinotarsa decemlineata]|uniref:uncharacterized protein n=1 Tax=Leptinotarsa decemlineata TaxID=7539 RepID=UPI000C254CA2|nr:uncharacterized protein LOC111506734 [Leptinotarsa decemlineata]